MMQAVAGKRWQRSMRKKVQNGQVQEGSKCRQHRRNRQTRPPCR